TCGSVTLAIDKSSFNCSNVGQNTVTLTVTDACANKASCTATVTVKDVTPPAAVCKNITIQLDASGHASITATDIDGGSSDACGIASRVASKTSFDCSERGSNNFVLTVTDVN